VRKEEGGKRGKKNGSAGGEECDATPLIKKSLELGVANSRARGNVRKALPGITEKRNERKEKKKKKGKNSFTEETKSPNLDTGGKLVGELLIETGRTRARTLRATIPISS